MATVRHLCMKATVTLAGLAAAVTLCSGCGHQEPSSTGGLSRTATQTVSPDQPEADQVYNTLHNAGYADHIDSLAWKRGLYSLNWPYTVPIGACTFMVEVHRSSGHTHVVTYRYSPDGLPIDVGKDTSYSQLVAFASPRC